MLYDKLVLNVKILPFCLILSVNVCDWVSVDHLNQTVLCATFDTGHRQPPHFNPIKHQAAVHLIQDATRCIIQHIMWKFIFSTSQV